MGDSNEINAALLAAGLVIYILASRLVMRSLGGGSREVIMALLNLAGVYVFFFYGLNNRIQGHVGSLLFIEYVCIAVFQYIMLRIFSGSNKHKLDWLAFFCPIAFLISIRYVPSPHGARWQASCIL